MMKKSEILKIVNDYIAKDQENIQRHEKIASLLLEKDGKIINKVTFRTLPEGWKLNSRAGQFYFEIDGNQHLIGYFSDPYVNHKAFIEKFDTPNNQGAKERIEKLQFHLKDEESINLMVRTFQSLHKTFNSLQMQFNALEGLYDSYHFPVYYQLMNIIMPNKVRDGLSYGDKY